MIALITLFNGNSFALFHVEHAGRDEWQYRWRITSSCPPAYGQWRECSTRLARVIVQPEIFGCEVAVEWRLPGGEWCQAALHRVLAGRCMFRVSAPAPFRMLDAAEELQVVASVADGWVAHYILPRLELEAGDVVVVEGVAAGPHPENVLLAAGEFRPVDSRLVVENMAGSDGSLVPWPDGAMVLAADPGLRARNVFAVVARNSNKQSKF